MRDRWASGSGYEFYVGRWSRHVAIEFLSWLAIPADCNWLDVGCGTGALSQTVLDNAVPASVTGIDPSPEFVTHAREAVGDPRARFQTGDAQHLPFGDESFDAVVSGLVLNFIPDIPTALSEMMRVARQEGTVAAYVWDYQEGMEYMRVFWDTATDINPAARDLDEGLRFPMTTSDTLLDLFNVAGLTAVECVPITIPTRFENFNDFWRPFTEGAGPAPTYVQSLTANDRQKLRNALKARLPAQPTSAINLAARAWAVRGIRE